MNDTNQHSPLATMRRRRPELFSDSETAQESIIQREVLDHHLETLTKRKQEYQFEHFARLIAEQELCPNIRPQTGPTGGGDSKVDAETYPVAPEVSERWYVGHADAGSERWAFAFSAKQKWEPKVKSDVDAIVATGRGYTRIFFVTSQYAPDKKRAALEDSLTNAHGVPVTILDRSWLLEKVSQGDRSSRALEALGIAPPERSVRRLGPNDATRLNELEDLDRKIGDPTRYRTARYSLAEDMLNAALAARGLGRDRTEVEGRFARAASIADEVGVRDQRLRIAYLHAWTTFWWFEDHKALDRMYDRVEELALASDHADDVQKLVSLWQLLAGTQFADKSESERVLVAARAARLTDKLRAMSADRARPNNAFQAEVGLALMQLPPAICSGEADALDAIWTRLSAVVGESANLLNFSLETMFELVEEVGALVPDSAAYDEMMDEFVDAIGRRRSEGAAGEANLRRGLQKLSRGKPYEAIRMLGRAELALAKNEHREVFITTLVALASAYQEAGLHWAARTKLLFATEQCFVLLRERGDIQPSLIRTLQRLLWSEIGLGRLPQSLLAWSYTRTLVSQMETDDETEAQLESDFTLQDAAIGILLLTADLEQLAHVTRLPDELGAMSLPLSKAAALWALGHEAIDAAEGGEQVSHMDLPAFFSKWVDQPLRADLPERPDLGVDERVLMKSVILGLEVTLHTERNPMSIAVSEAALSALEAFFSTSIHRQVMPWREEMTVEVASSGEQARFSTTWTENGNDLIAHVDHPARSDFGREGDRADFDEWLKELIAETIARALILPNAERWLHEIAGDEQGFSRAISLGNVPILSESLYGDAPRFSIEDWQSASAKTYNLLRTKPWNDGIPTTRVSKRRMFEEGRSFNGEEWRHSDRRISSIINMPLWNRAHWIGTGSLVADPGYPLLLGLAFRNREAGARIFEEWRERFGEVDEEESIRVSIILGINRKRPAEYAMTVGRTLVGDERISAGGHFVSLTRIQRMMPETRENLDRFLAAYRREGAYLLTSMPMKSDPSPRDFRSDLAILKKELLVREAWEIGSNDLDAVVIRPDEDPFLPQDGTVAPVLETIAAARNRRGFWDD